MKYILLINDRNKGIYNYYLLISSISFGIAIGVKSINALFYFIYILLIIIFYLRSRIIFNVFLISIFISILIGSYWYIDAILHGINIFSFYLDKDMYERAVYTQIPTLLTYYSHYLWIPISWLSALTIQYPKYDQRLGGLGIVFTLLLLPSILSLLFKYLSSLLKRYQLSQLDKLIFIFSLSAILYTIISPFGWWARFTIILLFVGIVDFIYLYKDKNLNNKYLQSFIFILILIPLYFNYHTTASNKRSIQYQFLPYHLNDISFASKHNLSSYDSGVLKNYKLLKSNKINQKATFGFIDVDSDDYIQPYIGDSFKNDVKMINSEKIKTSGDLSTYMKYKNIDYILIDDSPPIDTNNHNKYLYRKYIGYTGKYKDYSTYLYLNKLIDEMRNNSDQWVYMGKVNTHQLFLLKSV